MSLRWSIPLPGPFSIGGRVGGGLFQLIFLLIYAEIWLAMALLWVVAVLVFWIVRGIFRWVREGEKAAAKKQAEKAAMSTESEATPQDSKEHAA